MNGTIPSKIECVLTAEEASLLLPQAYPMLAQMLTVELGPAAVARCVFSALVELKPRIHRWKCESEDHTLPPRSGSSTAAAFASERNLAALEQCQREYYVLLGLGVHEATKHSAVVDKVRVVCVSS